MNPPSSTSQSINLAELLLRPSHDVDDTLTQRDRHDKGEKESQHPRANLQSIMDRNYDESIKSSNSSSGWNGNGNGNRKSDVLNSSNLSEWRERRLSKQQQHPSNYQHDSTNHSLPSFHVTSTPATAHENERSQYPPNIHHNQRISKSIDYSDSMFLINTPWRMKSGSIGAENTIPENQEISMIQPKETPAPNDQSYQLRDVNHHQHISHSSRTDNRYESAQKNSGLRNQSDRTMSTINTSINNSIDMSLPNQKHMLGLVGEFMSTFVNSFRL